MSATPKPPPNGLDVSGQRLWRGVLADVAPGWELDARDLHLLEQAARALDRACELEALLGDGLMIAGSTGQDRLHPAVSESRLQRQLSAVLLGRVELAAPVPKTGALSGRQRADLRRMMGSGARGAS